MFESLTKIFVGRSGWELCRDAVDVAVVAYLIYRLLLLVRGTRAMQMGSGLGIILLLYLASKSLGLETVHSLLSYVLSSIILIVIVVFQNDIRRALVRVGGRAWFARGRRQEQSRVIDEVVAAVTELARHRIGAIITFEQDASLLEFTKSEGVQIGAVVTRELLVALFYPESVNKLHDGAIIIRDLKIARAGVFFPMPDTKMADNSMGSRHRAALGITEETDAVVVVVSEERGTISFCFNGNIVPNIDATALRQTLVGILERKPKVVGAPLLLGRWRGSPKAKAMHGGESTRGDATSSPLPTVASATPLPKLAHSVHSEKARAEAVRSAAPEATHARRVSLPMPRKAKSLLTSDSVPPPGSAQADNAFARLSEHPPTSDRPSFVSSNTAFVAQGITVEEEAPKTPISGSVSRGSQP